MNLFLAAVVLVSILSTSYADMPTNCMYEDTVGKWELSLWPAGQNNTIDCNEPKGTITKLQIELLFPNTVVDQDGNIGTWTMIYNQGFSIHLNGRRYFAFQFFFRPSSSVVLSYCNTTFNGWVHDDVKDNQYPPKNWGCYKGKKLLPTNQDVKANSVPVFDFDLSQPYGVDEAFVERINKHQNQWKAGVYEHYMNFTFNDMIKRAGSRQNFQRVQASIAHSDHQSLADSLPEQLDWRDTDMVSPVRNQGACGSCYAFASMAALESGVRIASRGRIQVVFSPQDIVSCAHYSQGCAGGFPYLIAGMFAQDYGVIQEEDYPYLGNDTKTCSPIKEDTHIYASDYGYVGGFYGACNEALMRVMLHKVGPLVVGFNVTSDFFQYKGGIYHHTGLNRGDFGFNPFELTNHAVLVVGYGIDHDSGEKYWIVKNSWGTSWGEQGYFRIRRGTDELGIESMAVYTKPYIGY